MWSVLSTVLKIKNTAFPDLPGMVKPMILGSVRMPVEPQCLQKSLDIESLEPECSWKHIIIDSTNIK